jgi:hypothetical protein
MSYRHNHYVPEWYQYRFLLTGLKEQKFRYLDLDPNTFRDPTGQMRTKTNLRRSGPPRCFAENDLYTTKFGSLELTEIEEKFFGEINNRGRHAIEQFTDFSYDKTIKTDAVIDLLRYMSIQKLRTPKGLTVSLPTAPPNTEASRRTRRVLVPER